ncbi:hypothetical protein ATL41_0881 [Flavimobilis soli]|uniref:KANL3/Tex30 alpha/beta hydrolase-like domain-containing protein n=1 Tax=Flavimobilis soli TaxID=442709 RepID=A0A2A9ED37_9MICO|nr:alpha/beta family hydrolase [Flavimobilis soli]PFG36172.1 hypothetical protein ATL41_0881 [Flavimobilis soli]
MNIDVPTDLGPGRLVVSPAASARAVLWLGHGAGGGIDALDLAALADALPACGVTVVRYEQPWRVAGRKVAPRPAALDVGWLAAAPHVAEIAGGRPLVVGGRSAGARVACRTAESVGAAGVVCLAFPLHPPGKPERMRTDELLLPALPRLVLQGERDTFGSPDEVRTAIADAVGVRVAAVPGADHSMKVLKSSPVDATAVAQLVVDEVREFVESLV